MAELAEAAMIEAAMATTTQVANAAQVAGMIAEAVSRAATIAAGVMAAKPSKKGTTQEV